MTDTTVSTQDLFRQMRAVRGETSHLRAFNDRLTHVEEMLDRAMPAINAARDARAQARHAAVTGSAPASGRAEFDALAHYARTGTEIVNTISTAEPAEGGYTLVPVLADTLRTKLHDISAMARICSTATLAEGNTWLQPINTDLSGATWVAEKDARNPNTAPTFEQASIHLDELASLVPITQRALDDSMYDLGGFLTRNMAEQFARSTGAALLGGDGDKKPKGLLDYPSTVQEDGARAWFTLQHINTGASADFGTDPAGQLIDLMYSLRAPYRPNARWMMTRKTAAAIRKLRDDEGRFLWVEPLTQGHPPMLLGHPVELDEFMPEIGANAKAIAFGDFAEAYTMVQRPGLRLLRDPYTVKGSVLFYAYQRVGGGLINSEAVKLLRFGTA